MFLTERGVFFLFFAMENEERSWDFVLLRD
jgi:hypothetical protein